MFIAVVGLVPPAHDRVGRSSDLFPWKVQKLVGCFGAALQEGRPALRPPCVAQFVHDALRGPFLPHREHRGRLKTPGCLLGLLVLAGAVQEGDVCRLDCSSRAVGISAGQWPFGAKGGKGRG